MNIKGFERLIEVGLPVSRSTILFRTPEEIPAGHIDIYGDEPKWFVTGFDYKNSRIKDIPQTIRQVRALNVPRKDLTKVLEGLGKELGEKGICIEDRKYLIWEMHTPENVNFSGFGFRDNYEIMIDFFNGVRSSRTESEPCFSVQAPIVGEKPYLSNVSESVYKNHAIRISKDLMRLPANTSVDFVCLNDGYFFYFDLWQNK